MVEVKDLVQVAMMILTFAVVVRTIVEGLKNRGLVDPQNAGVAQFWLNFLIALGLFLAGQFGVDEPARKAIEEGTGIAPAILETTVFILTVLTTKGLHVGLKWAGVNFAVPKG